MKNDTFTEKISLWLDDELSRAETDALQAHLTECHTCQQAYQAMQRIDALFREGAREVAAPAVGFVERFETRLVQHRAYNGGHLWLGLGTLLLGTLSLLVITGVMVSVFVSAGINTLGVSLLYHWLARFIESANFIEVWLNFGFVFLKACLITMRQPLFWVFAAVATGLAWLWLRVIRSIAQRGAVTLRLFI
jgi:predicted anti-sigma-YlaC factor YlaD